MEDGRLGADEIRFPGAREKFNVLPKREQQIDKLKSGKLYDVLVIGGGATGTGSALVTVLSTLFIIDL